MEQYTIYCNPRQTEEAMKLGAPIERIPIGGRDTSRPTYFTKSPNEDDCQEYAAYYLPTAEQMIGWLESLEEIFQIRITRFGPTTWDFDIYDDKMNICRDGYNYLNRSNVTLAVIDAALEYLTNKK